MVTDMKAWKETWGFEWCGKKTVIGDVQGEFLLQYTVQRASLYWGTNT